MPMHGSCNSYVLSKYTILYGKDIKHVAKKRDRDSHTCMQHLDSAIHV